MFLSVATAAYLNVDCSMKLVVVVALVYITEFPFYIIVFIVLDVNE